LQRRPCIVAARINEGAVNNNTVGIHLSNRPDRARAFDGLFDNFRVYGSKVDASGALSLAELNDLRLGDVTAAGPAVSSNASISATAGTLVGNLTYSESVGNDSFTFDGGADDASFQIFPTADPTVSELRTTAFLSSGVYNIKVQGDNNAGSTTSTDLSVSVLPATSTYLAFEAETGVEAGVPAGGELVATLKAGDDNGHPSNISFSIVGGRDDLFQITGAGGDQLTQKADADPGVASTVHYVALQATNGTGTQTLLVAIEVGQAPGTVIRFR
jgi:hypothetical protein